MSQIRGILRSWRLLLVLLTLVPGVIISARAVLAGRAGAVSQQFGVQGNEQPSGNPVLLYGLTVTNRLVTFRENAPGTILSNVQITGLAAQENLLAIDFRPVNGVLYGLGSTSRLYTVNTSTGVASEVGTAPFTPALSGNSFGFDFNPVVDRIRIVSNTRQNIRLNPGTGVTAAVDNRLIYAAGDPNAGTTPNVTGIAYSNNLVGATTTTLYDVDVRLGTLAIQNPPNNGTLTTVGSLGTPASDPLGFDIYGSNIAYAVFAPPATTLGNNRSAPEGQNSVLYRINLATGAATSSGIIGGNHILRDLSAQLAPGGVTPTATPCGAAPSYQVLLVYADSGGSPNALANEILAQPGVSFIALINGNSSTPTLATMQAYDIVLSYSDGLQYADGTTLGNNLADYQDSGGVVVADYASFYNGSPGYSIGGRWQTGGYSPYVYGPTGNTSVTLGTFNAAHPLMQGVATLNATTREVISPATGATQMAAYSDASSAAAYKSTNGHTAVGLTAYIGHNSDRGTGDYAKIIVNAAHWLMAPCSTPTRTATRTVSPTNTRTRTATRTRTPVPTSTRTATRAVATATVTPTVCASHFTDVPSTSIFYAYIKYMYCHGVISGYNSSPPCVAGSAPCFLPSNPTTRGQVSKIVTLAFGFAINTAGGPHFSDVHQTGQGSTFYPYIETLYNKGAISGYSGTQANRCTAAGVQAPCFLPDNPVSRGQIAKIVVTSASQADPSHWQITCPSTATFQDVAVGSTFFCYVETAYSHGILAGYCANGATTCPPGSPKVFRPDNNATRAQICKIVYLAVTFTVLR